MWSWCHRISIPAMCWCYRATSNVLSVFQQVRPKLNPIQKGHGPYLVENKVAETGESRIWVKFRHHHQKSTDSSVVLG